MVLFLFLFELPLLNGDLGQVFNHLREPQVVSLDPRIGGYVLKIVI
jgi:hypothetical protein